MTAPLAVVLAAALASGTSGPRGTPDRSQADGAFAAGERAYRQGDYYEAATRFAQAHRLLPHPSTLFNLGLARHKAGDLTGAWDAFAELERTAVASSDRRDARAGLERLRPRIALVEARVPATTLVCLDGRRLSREGSPVPPRPAMPGRHTVQVDDHLATMVLVPGETRVLHVARADTRETGPSRPAALGPLLGIGMFAGAGAVGLGATAVSLDERGPPTSAFLIGATVAAGVALVTTVAGLAVHGRASRRAAASARLSQARTRSAQCRRVAAPKRTITPFVEESPLPGLRRGKDGEHP